MYYRSVTLNRGSLPFEYDCPHSGFVFTHSPTEDNDLLIFRTFMPPTPTLNKPGKEKVERRKKNGMDYWGWPLESVLCLQCLAHSLGCYELQVGKCRGNRLDQSAFALNSPLSKFAMVGHRVVSQPSCARIPRSKNKNHFWCAGSLGLLKRYLPIYCNVGDRE